MRRLRDRLVANKDVKIIPEEGKFYPQRYRKVFHGGIKQVDEPDLTHSKHLKPDDDGDIQYKDFGTGFYTTNVWGQAKNHADKVAKKNKKPYGVVSEYGFNIDRAQDDLLILYYDGPSDDWLNFILQNRSPTYRYDYDVVIGPACDDYVGVRLTEYMDANGMITSEDTIREIINGKDLNQVLFHTGKSLKYLKYLEPPRRY